VLVPPSPKLQDHEVGLPVEASVNWTDCPAIGEEGLKVNEAFRAVTTVKVLVVELESELLVTANVTVFVPEVA